MRARIGCWRTTRLQYMLIADSIHRPRAGCLREYLVPAPEGSAFQISGILHLGLLVGQVARQLDWLVGDGVHHAHAVHAVHAVVHARVHAATHAVVAHATVHTAHMIHAGHAVHTADAVDVG
jgi:hypothetical protein